jgi:DNA-binding CsgD family transcriptional regulator
MNPMRAPTGSATVSPLEWERRLLAMHGATDADEFIDAVFSLLQGTVECRFALANLRNVDGVPLLARDSLGREFGPDYMERFFKANPSVGYVMRRPGLRILHTRDHLPPEEKLRTLPFYTEFMRPENWRHSVALLFWGFFPPLPQNAFCVFRSEEDPDFDENDLARLRLAHPHINAGLKRLKKQLKARSKEDRITALLDALPGNATLLDWDLRVTNQSHAARRLAARWMDRGHESLPRALELPPEVLAACAEMKTEWREHLDAKSGSHIVRRREVPHPSGADLAAEVTLLLQQDSVFAHPGFLVRLIESASGAAAADWTVDLAVLTHSEREAVLLVAEGLDNAAIAGRLGIGVSAVKLRLHGAYKKLGVGNRTQLVARLR